MNVDIPLDDEQLRVVALVAVVVVAIAAAPILLAPSDDDRDEPNSGTVVTPEGDTLEEVDDTSRDPLDGLNAIPTSHLQDQESPTVQASAGAQTMRVETTTVDGEPALNLSDERTHDGRWVSVPTDWFNRTHGEVPAVARIAHEKNGTYTEAIQVRGDSAAFYVRGFSTNTVTFGGELVIRDQPAINGTGHSYQLNSRDSVDDFTVNLTGTLNSETESFTVSQAGGTTEVGSFDGTETVTDANISLTGQRKVDSSTGDSSVSQVREIYFWLRADSDFASITWELTKNGTQVASNSASYSGQRGKEYFTASVTVNNSKHANFGLRAPERDTYDARLIEVRSAPPRNISVSHGGSVTPVKDLSVGETTTVSLPNLSTSETVSVSTDSGALDATLTGTERTAPSNITLQLNSESVSYNGTLGDGESVELDVNKSMLRDGTNNITVLVGNGSSTSDGPAPAVDMVYRHSLESPRSVIYESEALSERYNISKTYTTPRENATLTIPHVRTVLSMRSVEYRINESGGWASVPQSAADLSGTTLTVDVSELAGSPVPEGTTVEVRSVGSRVDAHNAEISVVRATPVGFDLDSRVRLDSWSSDSYLEVGQTPQGGLVHYARNESYAAESEYVEIYADGSQQFYAPNASSGAEVTLNTLSARVDPEKNSIRVRVPESANATNTKFVVEPASVVGDSWTAEYVAGTDGQWYAVVDSEGEQLAAAEKPNALEVDRDDVGLVSIEPTDPQGGPSESVGGGIFATFTSGNLPSLLALFGGVGLLFVAGTRPRSSRGAIDGVAGAVGGLFGRIPRVGGPVGSAVETALSGAGSAIVSVGENRLLTGAVGAAVAVAAAQAGLFTLGSEAGAIIAVGGIAIASLFLLRQAEAFTTARWIAIVGVSGVVALQGLGETDLIGELVNSDAFLIVVLIAGYAAIQLVREYRANNSPNDDRPQIIIGGNVDDEEGSS